MESLYGHRLRLHDQLALYNYGTIQRYFPLLVQPERMVDWVGWDVEDVEDLG